MNKVLERYCIFTQDTKQELYSKTGKFWIQYDLIHLYRNFTRNVTAGNLDLYVSCLPEINDIFFAMNHLIYARWLVKYYDSLTSLAETHLQVYPDFQTGWFGIKQTGKSFLSTPTDLTLEQTIYA